jgi:hypothetical protein
MQRTALEAYRAVVDGIASIEHMLAQEDVWARLRLFGAILSPETVAALPAGLSKRIATARCLAPAPDVQGPSHADPPTCSWLDRRRLRASWKSIDDLLAVRRRAVALPRAGRDELLDSAIARAEQSSNPYVRDFAGGLERFEESDDVRRDRLNRLELEYLRIAALGYHAESKRWPARADELVASRWIARVPLDHFDQRPLTIAAFGDSIALGAKLLTARKTVEQSTVPLDGR